MLIEIESERIPIRSSTLIDLILIPEGIRLSISLNKIAQTISHLGALRLSLFLTSEGILLSL